MDAITHHSPQRLLVAAGLLGLTALFVAPGAAHASRIPADPLTFVGSPVAASQLVNDSHAANVWAALDDLHL